jgi:hypothetical protein
MKENAAGLSPRVALIVGLSIMAFFVVTLVVGLVMGGPEQPTCATTTLVDDGFMDYIQCVTPEGETVRIPV